MSDEYAHKAIRQGIRDLMVEAHRNARTKGFYDDGPRNIGEALALVHSEISEAVEELRNGLPLIDISHEKNGKPCGFAVELADAIIRIADLAAYVEAPLADAIIEKLEYNKTRPYKHGKKL